MGIKLTNTILNNGRNSQKNGKGACEDGTSGVLLMFISKLI